MSLSRAVLLSLLLAAPAQAEKLANKLFGAMPAPSSQDSMPIGSYARGCAAGLVELPETGPTWQAMRLSRNRNWGNPQLVDFLVGLSQQATRFGWPGLYIGDMSQPMGGPMTSGHASHQLGLDADIWMLPPPTLGLSPQQRENLSSVSVVANGGTALSGNWTGGHMSIMRAAASSFDALRSFAFARAISRTCALVTLPRKHSALIWLRVACPRSRRKASTRFDSSNTCASLASSAALTNTKRTDAVACRTHAIAASMCWASMRVCRSVNAISIASRSSIGARRSSSAPMTGNRCRLALYVRPDLSTASPKSSAI